MKLIIQVPCYNEESTLPMVVQGLPKELPSVDEIETLVIDDGSSDRTIEVARQLGVNHIVRLGVNRGLAAAFMAGIRRCVELGADIIVNTDGDNQYSGDSIRDLIAPIVEGRADLVVGERPIETIKHFSWTKKKLQRLGSRVVQQFSGTTVPDTTSGFRAYTAEAAMRLHVFNRYTYTLETIIQAGRRNMKITHVPIQVNPKTRESRLIRSIPSYIRRSVGTILRAYVIYKPLRTFFYLSLPPALLGLALFARFLVYYFARGYGGHVQSLILGAVLILVSFLLLILGVLADLSSANRELTEECLYLLRRQSRSATAGRRDE